MPSAALHLTHVQLLGRDEATPRRLRQGISDEPAWARLGAVLPDLPFYGNIVQMMLGYWLERPARPSALAARMHRARPELLAWRFIRAAGENRRLTEPQRLAVVSGLLAHMALDMELHPLVNDCARQQQRALGGELTHHHRLVEKYHSLFFHQDRFGRDPLGRPGFFLRQSVIVRGTPLTRLDPGPAVFGWLAGLLAELYPELAPTPRQVAGWVRAFRHFSLVVSGPWALRNTRRTGNSDNRQRYYHNAQFSFIDHWQRAYDRSLELLTLADRVLQQGDFSAASQSRFEGQAAISDLSGEEG